MTTETTDQNLTTEQLWAQETQATSSADGAPAPASGEDGGISVVREDAPSTSAAPSPAPAAASPAPAEAPAPQIDPQIQQLIGQLQAGNEALRRELNEGLRTVTGRVGALQSKLDKAQAPTNAQVQMALKTPKGMEQLIKDFPEIAVPVQEFLQENLAGMKQASPDELVAALQDKLAADLGNRTQAAVQQFFEQREKARVERAHPGWLQTINTPEFQAWRAAQPPEIQALGASDIAEDAIEMLNAYKRPAATVADVNARRAAVQTAARTSRGQASTAAPVKSEAEMTDKEYWDHLTASTAKR